MRLLFSAGAGLLLSTSFLFLTGASGDGGPPSAPPEHPADPEDVCATGCAAIPLQGSSLTADEYAELLLAFGSEPLSSGGEALEALLFHGARTRELIASEGLAGLDSERSAFLKRELSRTHALLDVRMIDEDGIERLRLGQKRVPFAEKQHIHPDRVERLQPPEVSGTLQRVGLKHLWARL